MFFIVFLVLQIKDWSIYFIFKQCICTNMTNLPITLFDLLYPFQISVFDSPITGINNHGKCINVAVGLSISL